MHLISGHNVIQISRNSVGHFVFHVVVLHPYVTLNDAVYVTVSVLYLSVCLDSWLPYVLQPQPLAVIDQSDRLHVLPKLL